MRIRCSQCDEVISGKRSYFHKGLDTVCGPECFVKWAGSHLCILQRVEKHRRWNNAESLDDFKVFSYDLGMKFRSGYELVFAEWLHKSGVMFEYEGYIFPLPLSKTYTPDFYLCGIGFVEIKGLWGVGQKKKMSLFKECYPDIPLVLLSWPVNKKFGHVQR